MSQNQQKVDYKAQSRETSKELVILRTVDFYTPPPCQGVLKGIQSLSQLTRNPSLQVAVLERALKHTENIQPPYTMEELEQQMEKEILTTVEIQIHYIRNPNDPGFLSSVRSVARHWFQYNCTDKRFPLTSHKWRGSPGYNTLEDVEGALNFQMIVWLRREHELATHHMVDMSPRQGWEQWVRDVKGSLP